MPINIPDDLPAAEILKNENVFIINESKALHQDIRPVRIAILNLMPTKIITENQLLRLLSNSPLQIEIVLLHPKTYNSKNTSQEHLFKFYNTFDEIKHEKFDGLIITGAPVEHLDFEQADYWEELKQIMDWSIQNVRSILYICWGAQAGLYHHFKIPKYPLPSKLFGVFRHVPCQKNTELLRGFDDEFYVPCSRYTEIRKEDIEKIPDLEILSESDKAGIYIVATKDKKHVFVTGHSEYDLLTLKEEYERDVKKGIQIDVPANYFADNNPCNQPIIKWKSSANLLFLNWLNYYIYQQISCNNKSL